MHSGQRTVGSEQWGVNRKKVVDSGSGARDNGRLTADSGHLARGSGKKHRAVGSKQWQ
jgi:hypothetical protein